MKGKAHKNTNTHTHIPQPIRLGMEAFSGRTGKWGGGERRKEALIYGFLSNIKKNVGPECRVLVFMIPYWGLRHVGERQQHFTHKFWGLCVPAAASKMPKKHILARLGCYLCPLARSIFFSRFAFSFFSTIIYDYRLLACLLLLGGASKIIKLMLMPKGSLPFWGFIIILRQQSASKQASKQHKESPENLINADIKSARCYYCCCCCCWDPLREPNK